MARELAEAQRRGIEIEAYGDADGIGSSPARRWAS
jgi:hypothetical protein